MDVVYQLQTRTRKINLTLHHYLDDWLLRAKSQTQSCQDTTQLLSLTDLLGFLSNIPKSALVPTQEFNFHLPRQDRINTLFQVLPPTLTEESISVRKLMIIIGLQAATNCKVHQTVYTWGRYSGTSKNSWWHWCP